MTKLLQQCSGYVSISEVPQHFIDTLLCINMNRFLLIALLVPAVKISAFYSHALLVQASKMSAFYIAGTRWFNADNCINLRIRFIASYASNTLTTQAYSVMLPLYFVDILLCVNMNRFLLIALLVPAVKISAFYIARTRWFSTRTTRTATLASAFASSFYASNTLTTHAYSVMLPLYFVHTLLCVNMNRFLLIALLVPAVKISAFYLRAVTRCFNADNCVLLH